MKIEKILFYLGCAVIAVGVIGGIYQWIEANGNEEYRPKYNTDLYEEYFGEIEEEINEDVSAYKKIDAYTTIIMSLIFGFLIIGFSTLISLVRELIEVNRKTNSYLDYFKVKPLK